MGRSGHRTGDDQGRELAHHLEYEWESPVWRHWIRFFSDNFRYICYDERGCGMTDLNIGDLSLERWVEDLETVVAAADPQGRSRCSKWCHQNRSKY